MRPSLASPTLLLLVALSLPGADTAKEVPAATITKLVDAAAKTKPDWWDQVTLAYPQTLDLSCPSGQPGGWNAATQPGVWMWDVVNPNPKRWKEGTKFWHFVLSNAKQNKLTTAEQTATIALGHCYGDLLQDWPRAIHWYRQREDRYGKNDELTAELANAYLRLGSRSLAMKTLKTVTQDLSRHGSVIQLWAVMGEYATAYRLAQQRVSATEDVGWYMYGHTAQLEGKWDKALEAFKRAEASAQDKSGRDWKQTRTRATAAIQAITLFEKLDLTRVADGTWRDSSTGYTGPVTVEVTVAAKRISSVRVTNHQEKQYYAALDEMPAKIIAKQHVKGVDATMGATITAEAIVYATAKALNQGQR